jgi:meso-butanediol dehydrogenase/(S,S)-butanediol dehydrogenase/diacetyl reductase
MSPTVYPRENEIDVTDDVAVQAMIASVVSEPGFGQLNVLCANAGIAKVGSLVDSSAAERARMFDVNVHGVMNTCVAAAKQMIIQGTGGRIIPTASIVALRPFPMVCRLVIRDVSTADWAGSG